MKPTRQLASSQVPLTITRAVLKSSAGRCARCPARAISICSEVEDRELARLAEATTSCVAKPGHCFIEEGDIADNFFSITAGCARLSKLLPDGRRQITGFAAAGHFLGLANRGTYSFSADAIGTVKFCRFSRVRMRRLVDDFPALGRRLLEFAGNELVEAQEQMLLLGRKTARERLASFLVSRLAKIAANAGKPTSVHLPMSRSDIGDYLGLTIETISRTLARLKAERLIKIPTATEIVILDEQRLKALATGQGNEF